MWRHFATTPNRIRSEDCSAAGTNSWSPTGSCEMRIPFHQLRFPKKDEYTWGVNFRRIIKRKNERVGYIWIPKDRIAFVPPSSTAAGSAEHHRVM